MRAGTGHGSSTVAVRIHQERDTFAHVVPVGVAVLHGKAACSHVPKPAHALTTEIPAHTICDSRSSEDSPPANGRNRNTVALRMRLRSRGMWHSGCSYRLRTIASRVAAIREISKRESPMLTVPPSLSTTPSLRSDPLSSQSAAARTTPGGGGQVGRRSVAAS